MDLDGYFSDSGQKNEVFQPACEKTPDPGSQVRQDDLDV